ncbi:MAG: LTA synthase family protein [Gammaproteobacteria bacterium]
MRLFLTSNLPRMLFKWGLLLSGLYLYSVLITGIGTFPDQQFYQQWLELILVCYLYSLIYLSMKPGKFRPFIAALPLFLLYLLHDVFFMIYGKVFRLINFSEVPELLQIIPLFSAILISLVFILPLALIIHRLNIRQYRPLVLAWSPLVILIAVLLTSPLSFVQAFEQFSNHIVKYSDAKSVEQNGRISMMLYREAQRQAALETILPYRERESYKKQITENISRLKQNLNGRNIHLVVLESFLDPRMFKKLSFSKSPAHPAFDQLFKHKLGLSKSPVFGGATAQAEFEVLCGVPAFEKLSSVEFNMFTGSNAYCLPGVLTEIGYRTVATNAYKPNFFNAIAGYRGTGFSELDFPVEFYNASESYLHVGNPGNEDYLFDSDLFEQNLAFVKKHLAQNPEQPLLNYIMTIYGHTPHILDENKRPEIITTQSPYNDDHLQRSTNQFYYRSEAIAKYVNELMSIDPDSLIIFIADHVPPLRNGPNTYNALDYLPEHKDGMYYTLFGVIENGKVHRYHDIHHYDIPNIVLNYLTGNQYCQQQSCAHLGDDTEPREKRIEAYLRLMAHASE